MKKTFFILASALLMGLTTISCEKANNSNEMQESILSINIIPEDQVQSKATGGAHGVQADDNTVQKLEFFVFRAEGADAGMLDAYKMYTAAELTSLSNLEVKTTTGKKHIYAVANSHKSDNWAGVKTLADFKAQIASLQSENNKDFTMTGSLEAVLQTTTSVTFSISRLVSRVQLASVKTQFAGTPWAGSSLTNVKMYLINAAGDKLYHDGSDQPSPTILNTKKVVATDINACTMAGMLYDETATAITDSGYNTTHTFYCYENLLANESADKKFTKLVIQADLNGHTYYYPISINREGFGYNSSVGHMGIKRNTTYTINVTILRPGSLDPDTPVEHSTMQATMNVADWATVPTVNVIF
ncbi:MAG: hypothetical protein E7110_02840 [Bacteroidales bacterium]|nr:hypothetical protein [Bacteroidales bacterium]